jgi:hypothetical protein
MVTTTFYHFGYSLLILPSQLLSDPRAEYRAALVINSILAALLYLVLYRILRDLFGGGHRVAAVIALCGALYPPVTYWTTFAMSESSGFLVIPLLLLLLFHAVEKGSKVCVTLFAVLSGFAYTIHPRFVLIPVLGTAWLLYLAVTRKIPILRTTWVCLLIVVICVLSSLINIRLLRAQWTSGGSDTVLAQQVFAAVRTLDGAREVALLLIGQVNYLIMGTSGLAVGGALVLLISGSQLLRKAARTQPLSLVLGWAICACTSIVVASVLTNAMVYPKPTSIGLLHGRFVDSFAPLLICLGLLSYLRIGDARSIPGLAGLAEHGRTTAARARVLLSILVFGACTILVAFVGESLNLGLGTNESVALGYLASLLHPFNFARLTVLAAAIAVCIDFILSRRFLWGVLVLLGLFFRSVEWSYEQRLTSQRWQESRTSELMKGIAAMDPALGISLDISTLDPSTFFGSQYLLPNRPHEIFASGRGERPSRPIVIASQELGGKMVGWHAVACTNWGRNYPVAVLWSTSNVGPSAEPSGGDCSSYVVWPADMPGQTGRIDGLSRVAGPNDAPGMLVFGQYLPLRPGEYRVSANYATNGAGGRGRVARWDVLLDTTQVVAAGEIYASPSTPKDQEIATTFRVPPGKPAVVFEFRLQYLGTGRLQVNHVSVDRLE